MIKLDPQILIFQFTCQKWKKLKLKQTRDTKEIYLNAGASYSQMKMA